MPNFWGLHHGITGYNELRNAAGKSFDFKATPYDKRMSVGDFVYLFWMNDSLYGWGIIKKLTPDADGLHQTVKVRIVRSEPDIAKVPDKIKTQEIFKNWDTLQEEGCLSRFNDEQLRFLNALLYSNSPPDPIQFERLSRFLINSGLSQTSSFEADSSRLSRHGLTSSKRSHRPM